MKIATLAPVHGRHEVVDKFLTVGDLPKHTDIYCVVSDIDDAIYCEAHNIQYTVADNNPLWKKVQAGLEFARQFEWDAIMMVGSDDLVFGIDKYIEYLEQGYDFVAVGDCYLREFRTGFTRYWNGYSGFIMDEKKRFKVDPRSDEPAGAGRCYTREFIERMDWKIWTTINNSGLDNVSWLRVKEHTDKIKIMKGEAKVVDLKTSESLTPLRAFQGYKRVELNEEGL